jgi:hypothetical protein
MNFSLSLRDVDLLTEWESTLIIWPKLCFQNALHFMKINPACCYEVTIQWVCVVRIDACWLWRLSVMWRWWEMNESVCSIGGITLTGKGPKYSYRNSRNCHFVHHKSHIGAWLNPSLRGERSATNHLSHDTATLRSVRGTIVTVERQLVLRILSVCL